MKWIKIPVIIIASILAIGFLLLALNVIWRSPPYYEVDEYAELKVPVMNMKEYEAIISTHRRPYTFTVKSNSGGKAVILGVEHLNDPANEQFELIRKTWQKEKPDIALVEGRMGFYFSLIHDPIERFGESGLLASLAKKHGKKLYTWEPTREDEIQLLLKEYGAEQLAVFYSLRPYLSSVRNGDHDNPEQVLQSYIDDRTDHNGIRGVVSTWQELEQIWKADFPDTDWRNYRHPTNWWPEGYLSDIANSSNLARDEHMIQIIIAEVEKGNTVMVTMGASHAPRIEAALQAAVE